MDKKRNNLVKYQIKTNKYFEIVLLANLIFCYQIV